MNEMSVCRKAALGVGVVFLLGAALGAVIGYLVSAASSPLPEPARRAHRVEQLTQALSLTSAQSQQVDAILLERHTEAKAIHDQSDAQLDPLHKKGAHQTLAILTPKQKPKL